MKAEGLLFESCADTKKPTGWDGCRLFCTHMGNQQAEYTVFQTESQDFERGKKEIGTRPNQRVHSLVFPVNV